MTTAATAGSTAYLIPLSAQIQTLSTTLAGLTYNLYAYWSAPNNTWMLDIYSSANALLIGGLPLVTGRNLLAPFAYLNIGGQLQVQSSTADPLAVPGINDLGVTGFLYFIPDVTP